MTWVIKNSCNCVRWLKLWSSVFVLYQEVTFHLPSDGENEAKNWARERKRESEWNRDRQRQELAWVNLQSKERRILSVYKWIYHSTHCLVCTWVLLIVFHLCTVIASCACEGANEEMYGCERGETTPHTCLLKCLSPFALPCRVLTRTVTPRKKDQGEARVKTDIAITETRNRRERERSGVRREKKRSLHQMLSLFPCYFKLNKPVKQSTNYWLVLEWEKKKSAICLNFWSVKNRSNRENCLHEMKMHLFFFVLFPLPLFHPLFLLLSPPAGPSLTCQSIVQVNLKLFTYSISLKLFYSFSQLLSWSEL